MQDDEDEIRSEFTVQSDEKVINGYADRLTTRENVCVRRLLFSCSLVSCCIGTFNFNHVTTAKLVLVDVCNTLVASLVICCIG